MDVCVFCATAAPHRKGAKTIYTDACVPPSLTKQRAQQHWDVVCCSN